MHFVMKKNITIGYFFLLCVFFIPVESKAILKFFDVPQSHENYEAIQYLAENGIITGFDDDSFRPENTISRAAFTKIVIGSQVPQEEIDTCIKSHGLLDSPYVYFSDVPLGEWFAPYVCVAKNRGIISGFPDGTFGPEKKIAFPAVAKILAQTFQLPVNNTEGEWYTGYINALSKKRAIPPTITGLHYQITRSDMSELVWRLKNKVTNKNFKPGSMIMDSNCLPFDSQNILGVDMDTVRETWLSWYNDERRSAKLPAYRLDEYLSRTATFWSEYSAQQGVINHQRPGQKAYYDYDAITQWFRDQGIEFTNVNGFTFTENIGYGSWNCQKSDCTAEMITKIREIFEFYIREKNLSSRPHYNAIFNPSFTKIGVGIAVNKEKKQFYITTHLAAEIANKQQEICQ